MATAPNPPAPDEPQPNTPAAQQALPFPGDDPQKAAGLAGAPAKESAEAARARKLAAIAERIAPYRDTRYLVEVPAHERFPFWRFVLLSGLLHIWLLLLFADASRPSDRQAGVLWGKLNVALKKLAPTDTAPPAVSARAPSLKLSTELGGASRPAPRANAVTRPQPAPSPAQEALPQSVVQTAEPVQRPLLQKPATFDAVPLQPLPTASASTIAPAPEATTRVDTEAATPLAPIAVPKTEAPLTMPSDVPTRFQPAPTAPMTPLVPATPAALRSVEALPESTSRVEAPATQALQPLRPAQPAAQISPLPEPASRVEIAPAQPMAPLTPTPARTLPSPQSIESSTRVEAPAVQSMQPLQPPSPAAQRQINRLPDEIPSRVDVPAETLAPMAPIQPRGDRPINRLQDLAPDSVPSPRAAPSGPVNPDLPFGLPDAGGTRPAPSIDPRATPRLDPNALRQRAREIDSDASRRSSLFAGPKLPPKSKEQEIFDKALKEKDCKNAYADMGLLAIAPLIASALAEERKCKW
ncbi:MAG: hypothetical protein JNM76_07075 [Betaproteobacteria bacterium]|nr:hypothetical protein [Betaproteobacteria bacterium]